MYPSKIITICLLFSLKGVYFQAFYRWLDKDWRHLFAMLPERTSLQRLLAHYEPLTDYFLVELEVQSRIES